MNSDTTLSLGKFHKFIWFFWMPISFIGSFVNAVQVIGTYSSNYVPFQYGGAILAIFLLSCIIEIIFVLAPIFVFVGFFKLRKFAWYILILESASNVIASPYLLIKHINNDNDIASIIGKIIGVVLDIIIILYYWQRKALFGVGNKKESSDSIALETQLRSSKKYCPKCGQCVSIDFKYCDHCGTIL